MHFTSVINQQCLEAVSNQSSGTVWYYAQPDLTLSVLFNAVLITHTYTYRSNSDSIFSLASNNFDPKNQLLEEEEKMTSDFKNAQSAPHSDTAHRYPNARDASYKQSINIVREEHKDTLKNTRRPAP